MLHPRYSSTKWLMESPKDVCDIGPIHPLRAASTAVLKMLMDQAFEEEERYMQALAPTENEAACAEKSDGVASGSAICIGSGRTAPAGTTPDAMIKTRKRAGSAPFEQPSEKRIKHSKERRKRKRFIRKISEGHKVRAKVRAQLIQPTDAISSPQTSMADDIEATIGGYQGQKILDDGGSCRRRELLELVDGKKYKYTPWDGAQNRFYPMRSSLMRDNALLRSGKTPRPLLDSQGVVFGVLAGRPNDDKWLQACERFFEVMSQEGVKNKFSDVESHHRRGDFPAINVGVTPGQGSKSPHNLGLKGHEEMLGRLLSNKDFQYLADWHNCKR